ncbi:hypothetical protein [uncultured Enterovirga sp.]|uniref:hypothetical protein n=1 Tax=uncultured Enterovirga sp. TaxID=2026352 RepID=UPI0035C9C6C6
MSAVHNERVKLTAAYLNAAAAACFAAGVVAPLAAAVFGLTSGNAGLSTLTLVIGVTIFFVASLCLHFAARYILRGLRS